MTVASSLADLGKAQVNAQKNRLFTLDSPFGRGRLLLDRFEGSEGISVPFHFHLRLLSREDHLPADGILGRTVSIRARSRSFLPRIFHGHVLRFARTGRDGATTFYRAELGPWTDFLHERINCRIFHQKEFPEFLEALFGDYGALARYELDLDPEPYRLSQPLVQYGESDLDFLSRILEERGIHYRYRMEKEGHTLVLGDDSTRSVQMVGPYRLIYRPEAGLLEENGLEGWEWDEQVVSTHHAVRSYDFGRPGDAMLSETPPREAPNHPPLERYEYAGAEAYAASAEGERLAQVRAEEQGARARLFHGASRSPSLAAGTATIVTTKGEGLATSSQAVLVTEVYHEGTNNYQARGRGDLYRNRFTAMPRMVPFRPPRLTPKPRIAGPQTAVVAGPVEGEPHCEPDGRIHVRFHWDREAYGADKGHLKVRVATLLAGDAFGFQCVPRVGQEVVVAFLDGDPDRPLVTGSVFNGTHPFGWPLPQHATQTGLLTRSWPGQSCNANMLRFEDRQGHEEVRIHAERTFQVTVEEDEHHQVGRDRSLSVKGQETTHVYKNRIRRVGGDDLVNVHGSRMVHVGGSHDLHVDGARSERAGLFMKGMAPLVSQEALVAQHRFAGILDLAGVGLYRVECVGRDYTLEVGRTLEVGVKDSFELKVGDSELVLRKDGTILLKGKSIQIEGSDKVEVRGGSVDLNPPGPEAHGEKGKARDGRIRHFAAMLGSPMGMELMAESIVAVGDCLVENAAEKREEVLEGHGPGGAEPPADLEERQLMETEGANLKRLNAINACVKVGSIVHKVGRGVCTRADAVAALVPTMAVREDLKHQGHGDSAKGAHGAPGHAPSKSPAGEAHGPAPAGPGAVPGLE